MTLLEMIKKYEDAKAALETQSPTVPMLNSISDIDMIVEDLKSIRDQQPSWVTVRHKIMKRIDRALENDDPESALKLAQTLSILPG